MSHNGEEHWIGSCLVVCETEEFEVNVWILRWSFVAFGGDSLQAIGKTSIVGI